MEMVVCPVTPDELKKVAQGFFETWNFHHVIGAIDGKDVAVVPLTHSEQYPGKHLVLRTYVWQHSGNGRAVFDQVSSTKSVPELPDSCPMVARDHQNPPFPP